MKTAKIQAILALATLGLLATITGLLLWHPTDTPAVNLLIGAVIALASQVGQYYFGSSEGSKRKTEMMSDELRHSK